MSANEKKGPDVTEFIIKNPLIQKNWEALLRDNVGRFEQDLFAWYDAWMRRLLPAWAYDAVKSGDKEKARKAAEYMTKEQIALVNPNGRSLERQIWKGSELIAVFKIVLVNER